MAKSNFISHNPKPPSVVPPEAPPKSADVPPVVGPDIPPAIPPEAPEADFMINEALVKKYGPGTVIFEFVPNEKGDKILIHRPEIMTWISVASLLEPAS